MMWDERFQIAKAYYEKNGHLRVKSDFKTKDGCTYDEEGLLLGHWINAQRVQYNLGELTEEHYQKLKSIGMIFEVGKNKEINQHICETHNIDYSLYKKEIDCIPHREFQAKINYLISQNLPIIFNQELNPIFFTSNINLEVRYGINLQNLIEQYYVSKTKVKGL